MTNICHLKVRKHITGPIEWLFNNFDVNINIFNVTWHSSCPRASKTNQRRSQECEWGSGSDPWDGFGILLPFFLWQPAVLNGYDTSGTPFPLRQLWWRPHLINKIPAYFPIRHKKYVFSPGCDLVVSVCYDWGRHNNCVTIASFPQLIIDGL